MTKNKDHGKVRLQQLLAAYGADRAKWPEPDRVRFAEHVLEEALPSDEVAGAQELDDILSHATAPTAHASAAARIAEEIVKQPGAEISGNVVEFAAEAGSRKRAIPPIRAALWPDAALIAASLVIGIVLGQSELLTEISFGFGSTGISTVEELGNAVLGLNIDPTLVSEDTL